MATRVSPPENAAFECLTALSVIFDLANGLAEDKSLLTAVFAAELAEAAGGDEATQRSSFVAALLRHLGCTAFAPVEAELATDDITLRARSLAADTTRPSEALRVLLDANHGTVERVRGVWSLAVRARGIRREWQSEACGAARLLAAGLGFDSQVTTALDEVFEHWDGSGGPASHSGEELSICGRVAQAAHVAVMFWLKGGSSEARARLDASSGTVLEPRLAREAANLVDAIAPSAAQYIAKHLEAVTRLMAGGAQPSIDEIATTFGDFADLQARFACGHSRAVASLCDRMAGALGLPTEEQRTLRLAAHLHDLGQVAVPTSIWMAPRKFGLAEHERARLHVYFTERVLTSAAPLKAAARVAGAHHERLDGTGYHRSLGQPALSRAARILAVADVACALGEGRPHRAALSRTAAAALLRQEVRDGKLDSSCVEAALAALGERSRVVAPASAALTARELEVLRLVALGQTNKQIARHLGISARTVQHHTLHIYDKLGVDTRAGAALLASRQGLLEAP